MSIHYIQTNRRRFLQTALMAGAVAMCSSPARLWASAGTVTRTQVLLGTLVDIHVAGVSTAQAEEALDAAFTYIKQAEAVFTRHDASSPLGIMRQQGSISDVPEQLTRVVARAQRYYSLTSGAFDVTVAPVLEVFRAHQNPGGQMRLDPHVLREAVQLVHAPSLHYEGSRVWVERTGMAVTLDGIAKGHIIDGVAQVLHTYGVHNHLINAGGDIRASGQKADSVPWVVGIEDPACRGRSVQRMPLHKAIATSGSYQIYFDRDKRHHHLINPLSGASPALVSSVSVTAPTALEADALATAFSVMMPHEAVQLAQSLPEVACCIIHNDGRILSSARWAGRDVAG